MCTMQLQKIETSFIGLKGGCHKIFFDPHHIFSRHFDRNLVLFCVRNRRWRINGPVATIQGNIVAFPTQFCRTFSTRVTNLQSKLNFTILMHKINNSFPGCRMFVAIQTGTSGGNAGIRRNTRHFGKQQSGAAHCPNAKMHKMEIGNFSIHCAIHGHG